jgi:hypothetical protein
MGYIKGEERKVLIDRHFVGLDKESSRCWQSHRQFQGIIPANPAVRWHFVACSERLLEIRLVDKACEGAGGQPGISSVPPMSLLETPKNK